jgi:hypothetical protein
MKPKLTIKTRYIVGIYYTSSPLKQKLLLISLSLFGAVKATLPLFEGKPTRSMGGTWNEVLHLTLFMNPAVVYAIFHGVMPIGDEPVKPHSMSIWSLVGIATQTTFHIRIGLSWYHLAPRPPLRWFISTPWSGIWYWYNFIGWGYVENAAFAFIQGRFLWVALKERRRILTGEPKEKYLLGAQ